MKDKCLSCKNAIKLTGAYTGTNYIECKIKKDFAETATVEQLLKVITNPELGPCKYSEGKPQNGGITYDD